MTKEKVRLIIALIFIVAFLSTTMFVLIYSMLTGNTLWKDFQPYFTALMVPASMVLGYYFNSINETVTTAAKNLTKSK